MKHRSHTHTSGTRKISLMRLLVVILIGDAQHNGTGLEHSRITCCPHGSRAGAASVRRRTHERAARSTGGWHASAAIHASPRFGYRSDAISPLAKPRVRATVGPLIELGQTIWRQGVSRAAGR